jgi:hypothetical protein
MMFALLLRATIICGDRLGRVEFNFYLGTRIVRPPKIRWPGADGDLRRIGRNLIALIILSVLAAIALSRAYKVGVPGTLVALLVGGGAPAGVYLAWETLRLGSRSETHGRKAADVDDERVETVLEQLTKTIRTQ